MLRLGLIFVVIVFFSGCGAPEKKTNPDSVKDVKLLRGEAEVERLLVGIPQKAMRLGDEKAPITITEFVDPRCKQCALYSAGTGREVIDRLVRSGSARVVYQVVPALGKKSYPAVMGALAASKQNRMASYLELFFRNQPDESDPADTEPLLEAIAEALPGIDKAALRRDRISRALELQARKNRRLAKKAKLKGVPTLVVSGKKDHYILEGNASFAQVRRAIRIVQDPRRPDVPATPLSP